MSVVFTTISDKFIAMCADKAQDTMPKIEKWAPHIAVGMSGNLSVGEYVRSTVHQFVTESGITNFSVEEIADLFIQRCSSLEQDCDEVKFIVAGRLTDKKLGAVVVRAIGSKVDSESFQAANMPATLILEPADLSVDRCNMLFGKALKNVEGKYLKNPLESIHRRAVRNVSEHSKSVNKESGYIVITP